MFAYIVQKYDASRDTYNLDGVFETHKGAQGYVFDHEPPANHKWVYTPIKGLPRWGEPIATYFCEIDHFHDHIIEVWPLFADWQIPGARR